MYNDIEKGWGYTAQLQETQQLAFTNTADSYATFGLDLNPVGSGVQQVMLRTSADVYVSFDTATSASQSFLVLSADTSPTVLDFHGGSVLTVHARGKSGSGTLYILGIRN